MIYLFLFVVVPLIVASGVGLIRVFDDASEEARAYKQNRRVYDRQREKAA